MHIETIDRREISEPLARAIANLLCEVFPKPDRTVESRTREIISDWKDYRGPEAQFPRSFVIRCDGRIVAHAEISPRAISTRAGEMTIGALAGVCTTSDSRRQGLGASLVREAFKLVDVGVYPFSLFQNMECNRQFYEKLGARVVNNRFVDSTRKTVDQNPFWAELAMLYPADKDWPSGNIDLRGPGY